MEGLSHSGIKEIINRIPRERDEDSDMLQIMHNTDMQFSSRLYSILDIDLMKIKLFESIEEIVKKPLLYVRDMTPKNSYEALIKLNQVRCFQDF